MSRKAQQAQAEQQETLQSMVEDQQKLRERPE